MGRAQLRQSAEKKKLIEAGEYWASASPRAKNTDGLEADFDQFGLSQELREQILADTDPQTIDQDFVVLAENAEALDVFMFCQSQWRTSMSGLIGLDYTAVIAVIALRYKKRKTQRDLLESVRLVESGALGAFAKMRQVDG
ncbi:DUF1799 domain-containing protein [Pseudohongiella spirulinae]|uniref:DUF1799 domain-containing protein n=1 Tax=Pseudohongiella spirulinae TaxID=1249552 RepID=UPI0007176848|nr:DUF1799 domain-containing protein [Pseudohongiella spirulinae]